MDWDQAEGASVGATIRDDWRLVESLLPAGWTEKARELGAFRRVRGFADPGALLQTMLIHLAEGCSLRETAARAEMVGLADVSDVALLKRLKSSERWFEWMAQQLREPLKPLDQDAGARATALLGARRLRVVDGSIVHEPGPSGSQWRLHYAIGLPGLNCQEVHLGPSSEGETLQRFSSVPGDVFIADRGYANAAGIAHVKRAGSDVIVRLNLVTLPLYDPESGARWDILDHLQGLTIEEGARSWPVTVVPKGAKPIQGRLCAVRKNATAATRARERVRRESQRGGHVMRPETLEAADYVFIFTTLSEEIDAGQVLALYRLRWQIELEFKRLKSLIQVGHLKKHDDAAARSWLQGKLLIALLVARMIDHAERVSPWGHEI